MVVVQLQFFASSLVWVSMQLQSPDSAPNPDRASTAQPVLQPLRQQLLKIAAVYSCEEDNGSTSGDCLKTQNAQSVAVWCRSWALDPVLKRVLQTVAGQR